MLCVSIIICIFVLSKNALNLFEDDQRLNRSLGASEDPSIPVSRKNHIIAMRYIGNSPTFFFTTEAKLHRLKSYDYKEKPSTCFAAQLLSCTTIEAGERAGDDTQH